MKKTKHVTISLPQEMLEAADRAGIRERRSIDYGLQANCKSQDLVQAKNGHVVMKNKKYPP